MAPMDPPARDIPDDDELDAILNGTLDGQDIFDISNVQAQTQEPASRPQKQRANESGLGIDEEIKIVKKRQPVPKLDESRLLSDPGIPKLRRITKDRLKFKGKGHEYGDIARMLNMYQLWLDDLYPRAKFADGLAIIEKLGHTKRIQAMRKQWIDEGKPRHTTVQDEDEPEPFEDDPAPQVDPGQMEGIEMEEATHSEEQEINLPERPREPADASLDDGPDEDELDALLAESAAPVASKSTASAPPKPAPDLDDPFADEMEAMADMDW